MIRGPRRLRLALALAVGVALLALAGPGCYDIPRPDCGFRCGPGGACPEGYTCSATDGRCHRDGAPPALVCGTVDAPAPPQDAAPQDAAVDAVDAEIDAMLQ